MNRLPGGCVVLYPEELRILFQVARIWDIRVRMREAGKDDVQYQVINQLAQAVFAQDADTGTIPRQMTASGQSEYMTVGQVARGAHLAERTVRLHLQQQILPASKSGRHWIIRTTDANTYIAARRRA